MIVGRLALALLAAGIVAACAPVAGNFVWVEAHEPLAAEAAQSVVIKPGDTIEMRVFGQDQMSGRLRVRSDGNATLPFLGDFHVAGSTPADLAKEIEVRLKDFINKPLVTLAVEEAKPEPISVIGQVKRAGQYPLENAGSVLQALAVAGGLTEFAKPDRIFVVRAGPPQERIRFRYSALQLAGSRAATFRLKGGDVVVVD